MRTTELALSNGEGEFHAYNLLVYLKATVLTILLIPCDLSISQTTYGDAQVKGYSQSTSYADK